MKYNEKFSKEEITHFERKIQGLVLNNTADWILMVKRLRPTKTTKTGEKKPGLYRHYKVVTYLKNKFDFSDKTAYRFINYLVMTPWFKVYSAEVNDKFELNSSYLLMSKIMNNCYEITYNNEDTAPNKYISIMKENKNPQEKQHIIVNFALIYDKLFFVDKQGNFWPIELTK